MKFYYSNRRMSPFFGVLILLALILLIPLISGFVLIGLASAFLGWIAINVRNSFRSVSTGPNSPPPSSNKMRTENSPSDIREAKVVVMDRDDTVIAISE